MQYETRKQSFISVAGTFEKLFAISLSLCLVTLSFSYLFESETDSVLVGFLSGIEAGCYLFSFSAKLVSSFNFCSHLSAFFEELFIRNPNGLMNSRHIKQ